MAPVKVLNRRHQKQTGDMSSGAGPCSVVNKSKTVIFIHTDSHSLSNTNTHTQGTLVKAVVAGEAAVRPGQRIGESVVRVDGSESSHYWVSTPSPSSSSVSSSLSPLLSRTSKSHSNDIRLAGTCEKSQILQNAPVNQPHECLCVHIRVFIPVAYCSDRQHSDVCTRAKHSFCSLPGTCRCYLGNGNKQSEVPGLVTTCSLNKLERWLKASLDFGLPDKFKAKSCEKIYDKVRWFVCVNAHN